MVLLTLESLRTDHVGAYGGASRSRPELEVTPSLDAFAARATVYEDAHAVTSWTLPSHASLFTGLYPTGHQTDDPRDRLDDSYPTLAEALAKRGYQTAGIVSGPYLRRRHNLSQGFEHWDDSPASLTNAVAHDDVTSPKVLAAVERFLAEQRDPERPLFLFVYFWDPHFDYVPPPPYDAMFVGPDCERVDVRGFDRSPALHAGMPEAQLAFLLAQYAGELRWTDFHVGSVLTALEASGIWDDALVIVTADHGEEFFDHGEKGHKHNLYAETTRVPLIVKYPGQREGRRDGRLVSGVDLLPTVLEVVGAEAGFPVHGRSLLAPPSADRAILFELRSVQYAREPGGEVAGQGRRWSAVREGDWKLVWSGPDGDPAQPEDGGQLFEVRSDPGEKRSVSPGEDARRARLLQSFETGIGRARRDAARYRRGGEAVLSPAEREQLEALGYFGP